MNTQYDFFLCFSQNDAEIALELHLRLTRAGLRCFMAEKDIPFRKRWEPLLRDALSASEKVILLITPRSVGNEWILAEAEKAREFKKEVIPILRFVRADQLPESIGISQCRTIETQKEIDALVNDLADSVPVTNRTIEGLWRDPTDNDTVYFRQTGTRIIGLYDCGVGKRKVGVYLGRFSKRICNFRWRWLDGRVDGFGRMSLSEDGKRLSGERWLGETQKRVEQFFYNRVSDVMPSWLSEKDFEEYAEEQMDGEFPPAEKSLDLQARWADEALAADQELAQVDSKFCRRLPLVLDSVLRAKTLDAFERSMVNESSFLWEGIEARLLNLNTNAIAESELIDDQPDYIFIHGDRMNLRRISELKTTSEGPVLFLKLVACGVQLGEFSVARPGRDARFSQQECDQIRTYAQICSQALYSLLAMEKLRQLALTDQLTGVPNRRALEKELDKLAGETEGVALLFLDADGLGAVNNAVGYQAGNELISVLAKVLLSAIADGDFAGRLGGDEFVAVLRNVDKTRAERVRAEIEERFANWELPAEIKAHCKGVSVDYEFRKKGESASELLCRAAEKMKMRKKRRKEDRNE